VKNGIQLLMSAATEFLRI